MHLRERSAPGSGGALSRALSCAPPTCSPPTGARQRALKPPAIVWLCAAWLAWMDGTAPALAATGGINPTEAATAARDADAARARLVELLEAEPGDGPALMAAAAASMAPAALTRDPTLPLLLRLARARALLIDGRHDDATSILTEVSNAARDLPPATRRDLLAQVRYRQGEAAEQGLRPLPSCGPLGLERVAHAEGERARDRGLELAARYRAVLELGERFWARRAAFRMAALSEELLRASLEAPAGFRGAALPAPLALSPVDTSSLMAPVLFEPWRAELTRLYREVIASIDEQRPDADLRAHAEARLTGLTRLAAPAAERVQSPWVREEKTGLVRFVTRHERRAAGGSWTILSPVEGNAALAAQLAAPLESVEHAYALAGLATDGQAPPPVERIAAALASSTARVRLAGLIAAERQPAPVLREVLVAIHEVSAREAESRGTGPAFGTLQGSLFGLRERALLALRAVAARDREGAAILVAHPRLPRRERAWLVAELGDEALIPALQALAVDPDPVTAATATYAVALMPSGRGAAALKPWDPGLVGCVSRALARGTHP